MIIRTFGVGAACETWWYALFGMKSIVERLNEKTPVILDGAIGTELFRRGVETRLPCWSAHALLHRPELVQRVHEDYVRVGAEILTTNTFRTSFRSLNKSGFGHLSKQMTNLAVRLAMQAREECASTDAVWIAGSVAPLEDCYEPQLMPDSTTTAKEHAEMIDRLCNAGVDLLLIETMNSIEEAAAAAECAAKTGTPFFVSWVCGSDGKILNGESLASGVRILQQYHPSAFLVNCTPTIYLGKALTVLIESADGIPAGAYGNIGKSEPVFGWEFTNEIDPDDYSNFAREWFESGAKIIGGCCGTTPDHIRALRTRIQLDQ